jgi:predicted TIM-barrel fold metal-dependent hydrolase
MERIGILDLWVGALWVLALAGCATDENERRLGLQSYQGRMIDAHSHPKKQDKEELASHFADAAKAGIARIVVMRTPNDYRKSTREKLLRRAARFPNVTTLCSPDFAGHIHKGRIERARAEVAKIKEDLDAGRCAGVGELGLRHYDKRWSRGGGQHEVILPLDHPLVHEVLAVANVHAVPVLLHIEPVYRPRSIDNLTRIKRWDKEVCRIYPRARLIAAHTGMMSPPDLEEIFLSCPNLFADFKVLHTCGSVIGFADLHGVNDLDFRFFEHWTAMFEEYPDRFIFGSDWKEGRRRGYRGRSYRKHISRVRKMIGSLPPSVQKNLAYSNAKRVFRLP